MRNSLKQAVRQNNEKYSRKAEENGKMTPIVTRSGKKVYVAQKRQITLIEKAYTKMDTAICPCKLSDFVPKLLAIFSR